MISGKSCVMAVHVMLFGVMMEVLVFDGDVVVPVHMLLSCEKHGPQQHKTEGNHDLQAKGLPEDEKREGRTDERRDAIVCARPRRAEIPEGTDEQDHAHAIAEEPQKQCGENERDPWKSVASQHREHKGKTSREKPLH